MVYTLQERFIYFSLFFLVFIGIFCDADLMKPREGMVGVISTTNQSKRKTKLRSKQHQKISVIHEWPGPQRTSHPLRLLSPYAQQKNVHPRCNELGSGVWQTTKSTVAIPWCYYRAFPIYLVKGLPIFYRPSESSAKAHPLETSLRMWKSVFSLLQSFTHAFLLFLKYRKLYLCGTSEAYTVQEPWRYSETRDTRPCLLSKISKLHHAESRVVMIPFS